MKTFILLLVVSSTLFSQQSKAIHNYLNEIPPDSIPLLFAKGIISTDDYEHSSPAFSPTYDEIYWSIRINGEYGKEIIKYTRKEDERWSAPEIPSFSKMGKGDLYPTFSEDGEEIFFTSDRSESTNPDSINRFIWRVVRNGTDWSSPEVVGFDSLDIYGLSISSKGTLYFMAQKIKDRETDIYDIYYSPLDNSEYKTPEKIEFPISTEYYEDCPFISNDESFMLFESSRPGGVGKLDLYISVKTDNGNWGPPKNLGNPINSESSERFPYISPDGKYFFFVSGRAGSSDIYWISTQVIYDMIN